MSLPIPVPGWPHVPYAELHQVFAAVAVGSCPSSQAAAITTGKDRQHKPQYARAYLRNPLKCK